MFALAQLTQIQFQYLCKEIGNEKVISFAEKIKLFGGNVSYSKKYQNYRNEKLIEKYMFEKRYSTSLQRFFDDEIKKKGYNNLEEYYKQVLVKLKDDNDQENSSDNNFKTENPIKMNEWFPTTEEYNPNFSIDDWLKLLADENVFDNESYAIMINIYDNGGQASCKELSEKYGNSYQYYISKTVNLAKRIQKKTNCPLHKTDTSETTWFTILFFGKYIIDNDKKIYVWKLRDELYKAINIVSREQNIISVNSWLLAYNLEKYDWENVSEEYSFDTMLKRIHNGGAYFDTWKCMNLNIKEGDRIYIIKLGEEPRGIIAKGYAVSDSYNFNDQKSVDIIITDAFDYRSEPIIFIDTLKKENPDQHWSIQNSGITIKPEAAKWLVDNWESFHYNQYNDIESELEEIDESKLQPVIWKISHGTNSTGVPEELRETLEKRKVVTLHRYTKPLATSNISQGESFMTQIKSGDYFYLCYGAEIVLFGQFLNGSPKPNHEMAEQYNADNWYEREYKLIAVSKDRNKYNGVKKWWTSNQNSTCVKVTDNALFEELILEPYFGLKLSDLQTGEYHEPYTKEDFLKDVFITGSEYDKLRALVLRKKNIILQGAPGVGKTFSAKRLAYSIIGEKNESRICMVQFHQNYSYEDFIMGYRPNDSSGFELQSGVFYNFCIRCQENPDKPYFFIIDEINRGNLSKIFGELLMLIETDKRGEKHKLNLVYGGTALYIPENLHIIGMMNTADRSLAMIDYALRRRFSFYTMQPAFDNAANNGFEDYTKKISCALYKDVISTIRALNKAICDDTTLGKGFEIGHSYFAPEYVSVIDDEWVRNVVEYEIIPLIEEYWFDNDKMLGEWTKTLYHAIGEEYDC